MFVITGVIFYNLKFADDSKIICGSASEAEYACLGLWDYIVFSRWLNGNVTAGGLFESCQVQHIV